MKNAIILSVFTLIVLGGFWFYSYKAPQSSVTNQMGNLNSGENPQPGGVHGLAPEPAAAAARADLAAQLGVNEGSIVIMLVEEKTWSDGCLGLGGPAESCIAALVDGFRVELEHDGKTYVYRTDKTGASLRLETKLEG